MSRKRGNNRLPSPPVTNDIEEVFTHVSGGVRKTFRQQADGAYKVVKEEKLSVSDSQRRFRLRPISVEMRKTGQRRRTYTLKPQGWLVDENGKDKVSVKGNKIGKSVLKFWQSNFDGQKCDPAKQNVLIVDKDVARRLETMSDVFEEVYA